MSADSIVPGTANPQAYNRYSYTLNNPIRYTDPTGHKVCEGTDNACKGWENVPSTPALARQIISHHGVTLSGNWDTKTKEVTAVAFAVVDIGYKLASERHQSESSANAFKAVYDHITITWGGTGTTGFCTKVSSGGCTSNANQINFWSMSDDMVKNVVHELGHAFYHAIGSPLLGNSYSRDALIRNASYGGGEALVWEQHPISMNDPQEDIATELFADTFIAWTYDTWNPSPPKTNPLAVNNAQNEMDRIASSIP